MNFFIKTKPNNNFLRRQDSLPVYDMNNAIYIYNSDYLRDEKNTKAVSDNSIAYIMDELTKIDIDTELDFQILEALVKEGVVQI